MQNKSRSRVFALSNVLFIDLLFCVCTGSSLVTAQQDNKLENDRYRNVVLQQIDSLLETKYVLPEKAAEFAKTFRKKCNSGSYSSYVNSKEFAKKITADLIDITNDQHINFRLIQPSSVGETPESSLHHPIRYHVLGINENKGFTKLEWFEGNVGYLDIRRFYNFADIKDMVIGAMTFLSHANAIIVDLRENGGGSGDYLSSYFLQHPTQLNSWYSREDDFLTEFWTSKEIGVKRLTEVPLFLLTSERTFSASESFAYDMKVRKRATIIGDSTRGGAHSVDLYKIGDEFEIYIPTTRAINPITGTNWEGTGVIPDIIVPSEVALDTAIVLAKRAGAEVSKAKDAEIALAVEEMEKQLDRAETLFRENRTDEAGTALDAMFELADEHDLVNEFFIDVLAYNYRSREDEKMLYEILKKKIELYPRSHTSYESLAYAYYMNDRKELAIANFETVLELDPDNRNAKKMIKRIRDK